MTRRLLPAAFAALIVLAAGCAAPGAGEAPAGAAEAAKPRRIVSLTLGTDEILAALVEPDRIAALSRHAANPEVSHVAELATRVGVAVDRDPEQIVALNPDLVLAARYANLDLREVLGRTGAAVVVTTDFVSFDDIRRNVAEIGRAVGEPERAAAVIAEMDARLASVRAPAAGRGGWRLLYYAPGGWTAGAATTIDEVIRAAGFRNAAAEAGVTGHQIVSTEALLAIDPDALVIGAGYTRDEGFRERILADPLLATLSAVRRGRIATLPARQLLSVSPHLAGAAPALTGAVEALR